MLLVYVLALWIGFRSGEIYNRMKNKVQIEKIAVTSLTQPKIFFVVEKKDNGDVEFSKAGEEDVIIKFLYNEKLKPLLKRKDIEIYDSKGARIY